MLLLLRGEKRKPLRLLQWNLLFKIRFCRMASSLLPMPLPLQREVHLWYMMPEDIKNQCLLDQYLGLLSPTEKDDVLCRSERLQKGALLTRALVRTTISRYTNCKISPKSLKFKKNIFGKPEVDWQHQEHWNPPNLHFNISHSPSLVACGVAIDVTIGIDVEEKLRQLRNDVLRFARRYFSPQEVDFLCSLPDPETQRQEVIKIWTLKEAYVKAIGRGFSAAPFSNFVLQFKSCKPKQAQRIPNLNGSEILIKPCHGREVLSTDWEFALCDLEGSHYAAICMGKDTNGKGEQPKSSILKIWKTIPFIEDVYVSGSDKVVPISGFA